MASITVNYTPGDQVLTVNGTGFESSISVGITINGFPSGQTASTGRGGDFSSVVIPIGEALAIQVNLGVSNEVGTQPASGASAPPVPFAVPGFDFPLSSFPANGTTFDSDVVLPVEFAVTPGRSVGLVITSEVPPAGTFGVDQQTVDGQQPLRIPAPLTGTVDYKFSKLTATGTETAIGVIFTENTTTVGFQTLASGQQATFPVGAEFTLGTQAPAIPTYGIDYDIPHRTLTVTGQDFQADTDVSIRLNDVEITTRRTTGEGLLSEPILLTQANAQQANLHVIGNSVEVVPPAGTPRPEIEPPTFDIPGARFPLDQLPAEPVEGDLVLTPVDIATSGVAGETVGAALISGTESFSTGDQSDSGQQSITIPAADVQQNFTFSGLTLTGNEQNGTILYSVGGQTQNFIPVDPTSPLAAFPGGDRSVTIKEIPPPVPELNRQQSVNLTKDRAGDEWQTVALPNEATFGTRDVSVFAFTNTINSIFTPDTDPSPGLRIRKVAVKDVDSSFQMRFDGIVTRDPANDPKNRQRNSSGNHEPEDVAWVAFANGRRNDSNDPSQKFEIRTGKLDLAANRKDRDFAGVGFSEPMNSECTVVFPMTNTYNSPVTPGLRIQCVSNFGFEMRFNGVVGRGGKCGSPGDHAVETVGWVAFGFNNQNPNAQKERDYKAAEVDEGRVVANAGLFRLKADRASGTFRTETFQAPFPSGGAVPLVFAFTQTLKGGQSPGLRIQNVTHTGFEIRFNENVNDAFPECTADGRHANDFIGFIALLPN